LEELDCFVASLLAMTRVKSLRNSKINGAPNRSMKDATQRTIIRWIHIVCSIPIIGYIYSPFEHLPDYAPPTRFVFLPVMLLSGLWMWKGHVVQRLVSKRAV
jgi:hypothetical protein